MFLLIIIIVLTIKTVGLAKAKQISVSVLQCTMITSTIEHTFFKDNVERIFFMYISYFRLKDLLLQGWIDEKKSIKIFHFSIKIHDCLPPHRKTSAVSSPFSSSWKI